MVALLGSIEHTDATDVYRLIIRDSNRNITWRIFSVQDVSVISIILTEYICMSKSILEFWYVQHIT